MPQDSPPVLIIRLDGIGDALALTPLLAALRSAGRPVDLVLREDNASAFSRAAVRDVAIAPFELRTNGAENAAAIARFGVALASRGYAAALVATEDPAGYRLAVATAALRRAGFANGWGKPLKTLWVRSLLTTTLYRPAGLDRRRRHECEVLFELGRGLVEERVPTRELARLRPLVLERDVVRHASVAVQVTHKWERFGAGAGAVAQLLRELARQRPVRAIASSSEGAFADAVERAGGAAVERFEALEPWKEAIAAAAMLVAPDSGAVHVAGMVGTPTVALFARRRDLAYQVARWHPWAAPFFVVQIADDWIARTVAAVEEHAAAR
ncbi:MAG: glycosyltransferase family 9 protein [Candidatus Tyrphobacter sp.]